MNAAFVELDIDTAAAGPAAMAATWGVSQAAAFAFYRWIELPANRLRLPARRDAEAVAQRVRS